MNNSAVYRFTIRNHLDDVWMRRFSGFRIERTVDGYFEPITCLTGRLPDQAALLGTIALISQLGLELLEFIRMEEP